MRIELPWPPSGLSPNARVHRMVRAGLVRGYRADCGLMALHCTTPKERGCLSEKIGPLNLLVTFWHPTKRRPDVDNMLASIKAGIDGVCQSLRIDDSQFQRISLEVGGKRTGGAVILEIT